MTRRVLRSALFVAAILTLASEAFAIRQPRMAIPTLTAEVRIDGKREDFAVLNGGQLGPKGMLALTFRQDAQVRLYDMQGKRVAVVGKRGSGPGEFRTPQAQGWLADTLWIYDVTLSSRW